MFGLHFCFVFAFSILMSLGDDRNSLLVISLFKLVIRTKIGTLLVFKVSCIIFIVINCAINWWYDRLHIKV